MFANRAKIAILLLLFLGPLTPNAWAPVTPGISGRSPEYTNLFLPAEYRNRPPEEVPQAVIDKAQTTLEAAILSRVNNLEVPTFVDVDGKRTIQSTKFVKHWNRELGKVDPTAHLLPSGGMVRQIIEDIYFECHEAEKHGRAAQETLDAIAVSKDPVKLHNLIGIGSDADFQIVSKSENYDACVDLITRGTSGLQPAGTHSLATMAFRRALFLSIDLPPHETVPAIRERKSIPGQFNKAADNAGITTDLFVFDPKSGKLRAPKRFPNLTRDFMLGILHYPPPINNMTPEERTEWSVRAIRSLLEMPWMRFANSKEEKILMDELDALRQSVERGGQVSARTQEAIARAWRNVQEAGANNAIYRRDAGPLEKKIRATVEAIQKHNGLTVMPKFVPRLATGRATVAGVAPGDFAAASDSVHDALKKALAEHLIPREKFIQDHTQNGEMLHGTESLNAALAILKGNIVISDETQGGAKYGRGAYFTDSELIADRHPGQGVIVRLKLKDGPIKIVDWPGLLKTDAGQKFLAACGGNLDNAFEILSERYGVDIVQNFHTLVQNSEVFDFPKVKDRFRFLLNAYASQFNNLALGKSHRSEAYQLYGRVYEHAREMGEDLRGIPSWEDVARRVMAIALKNPDRTARWEGANAFLDLTHKESREKILPLLAELIHEGDEDVKRIVAAEIKRSLPEDPKDRRKILRDKGLIHDLIAHGGDIGFWGRELEKIWTAEDVKEVPKWIEGKSKNISDVYLERAAHSPNPEIKKLDFLTKARLAARFLEDDYKRWPQNRFDLRADREANYSEGARAGLNVLGVSLPQALAAVPLNSDSGLDKSQLRAAMEQLKVKASDLAKIDPQALSRTFDRMVEDHGQMVLLDREHNAELMRKALADQPELGTWDEWQKIAADLETRLETMLRQKHSGREIEDIYRALFRVPTFGTFDFAEMRENASTFSKERALGLIAALKGIAWNEKHATILRGLGGAAAHPDSEVRLSALKLLLQVAGARPGLSPLVAREIQRFGATDVVPLLRNWSVNQNHGRYDDAKTLRELAPQLWMKAIQQALRSEGSLYGYVGRLIGDKHIGAPDTMTAAADVAMRALERGESERASEALEFLRQVMMERRSAPGFEKAATAVLATLERSLLPERNQEMRELIGSVLLAAGGTEERYYSLAHRRASRLREAVNQANAFADLARIRPEHANELRNEIANLAERHHGDSGAEITASLADLDKHLADCAGKWAGIRRDLVR